MSSSSSTSADGGWTDRAGLLLLLLVVAMPMLWIAGYSLLYGVGGIGYLSKGWTLEHWRSAFGSGGLGGSVVLSVAVAAAVALIATAAALAIVLWSPDVGRRPMLLGLMCLPLATPVSVAAFAVMQLLGGGGLASRLSFHFGAIDSPADFPVLVNDSLAVGIVAAHLFSAIPLLTLYFSQLWTTVRADRYCALAESLGASPQAARLRVALPLLWNRGRSLVLLVFLLTLGSFEIPYLLGRQSPQMFSVLTHRRSGLFDLTQKPEAFVLATVYLALVSVLLVAVLRMRRRHE